MGIQLIVNKRCYRSKFAFEQYMGSDDIFALVASGRFVFASPEEKCEVKENEGVLYRKNVLYERHITEPAVLHLFRFRSAQRIFERDHVLFSDITRIKSTISMLEKLENAPLKDEFEYRKHLFSDIISQYNFENERFFNKVQYGYHLMELAVETIKQRLGEKLILTEISEKTGLSYVQFLRRFQAYTGVSPSDYVITLRLQQAKNLLVDTDLLIKDIASLCGFENEYYFSNTFRKNVGMSPSSFRKL